MVPMAESKRERAALPGLPLQTDGLFAVLRFQKVPGDIGGQAVVCFGQAVADQMLVGGHDRIVADAELPGMLARRGQGIVGFETACQYGGAQPEKVAHHHPR